MNKVQDTLLTIAFIILALGFCGAIGYLKIDSLHAWRYTSDLFTYDTVLRETLRGHPGLEFTYGNTYGDHAYPFLTFLLPFKFLLKTQMVKMLLLLCPITCLFSTVILYFAFKESHASLVSLSIAGIALLGLPYTFDGIYESLYGFHPDTLSGYCAVLFTSFLIWYQYRKENSRSAKIQLAGFWIFFLIFIFLKEEMALLGFVFFLILVAVKRSPLSITAFVLASMAIVFEFFLIKSSQTQFNRTNEALLASLVKFLHDYGLGSFLNSIGGSLLLLLTSLTIAYIFLCFFTRQINWVAFNLFLIGLLKISFGFATKDFNPASWHNFPGLVMMLSAVLWQFFFIRQIHFAIKIALPSVIFLAALTSTVWRNAPIAINILSENRSNVQEIHVYSSELSTLQQSIDQNKIISIPPMTASAWLSYRYSFFPRGLIWAPQGIADYIVYPLDLPTRYNTWMNILSLHQLEDTFAPIAHTQHFILLRRIRIDESQLASRRAFFSIFGLSDLLP